MSITISSHNGENWPYHLYEGSKPELQGSYVPCANNPCSEHGGSEVYATSPDNAYQLAHKNDNWGFTTKSHMQSNEVNTTTNNNEASSNTELIEQSSTTGNNDNVSNANTVITTTELESNDNVSNANTNNDTLSDNSEEVAARSSIFLNQAEANKGYTSIKARDIAIKQGLYINGSPLLHRLTSSDKKKYKNGDKCMNMQAFAHDVFPGVPLANDYIDDIRSKSNKALNNLSESQLNSIKAYTGSTYKDINTLLRTGKLTYESDYSISEINTHIKNIHSLMNNNEVRKIIDKDTVVFRKRYLPQSFDDRGGEEITFYNAVAKSMKDGSEPVITRADFMSTNWDVPAKFENDGVFDNVCSYLIKIPAGTRCLDVSSKNGFAEKELLIDKGYKLKVVGIYEFSKLEADGDNKTKWKKTHPIIALELIENNDNTNNGKLTN